MTQLFTINGRLSGLNEYIDACRANRHQGAKLKRQNQDIVLWSIKAAKLDPVQGKVNVLFRWVEPDMRRDKDNIRFAAKFIFDALVEEGILKNDNWTYIGDIRDEFFHSSEPRIEVTIEEVIG